MERLECDDFGQNSQLVCSRFGSGLTVIGKGKLSGDAGRSRVVDIRSTECTQVVAEISAPKTDCGDQQNDQEQLTAHAITSD